MVLKSPAKHLFLYCREVKPVYFCISDLYFFSKSHRIPMFSFPQMLSFTSYLHYFSLTRNKMISCACRERWHGQLRQVSEHLSSLVQNSAHLSFWPRSAVSTEKGTSEDLFKYSRHILGWSKRPYEWGREPEQPSWNTVASISSVFPSGRHSSSGEPSHLFVPFRQIPSPSIWNILAALHPPLRDSCSLHGLQFAIYSTSLPHCSSVGHSSAKVSPCASHSNSQQTGTETPFTKYWSVTTPNAVRRCKHFKRITLHSHYSLS